MDQTAVATQLRGRHTAPYATVLAAAAIVFWPTVRNGLLPLGFDDAIITDTPALGALTWSNLRSLATDFNQAHYVPLTMWSLALDRFLLGPDPFGHHLVNVLLHVVTAVLTYQLATILLPSRRAALVGALLYAVHPLQLEAVAVAMQRKTVLSGALFFGTLLLYQRWRTTGGRKWYALSVGAFALAGLAKPSVISLPLVLVLVDWMAGRPIRVWDKLPFILIAVAVGAAAAAAHASIGATHDWHGSNIVAHLLMVSRVLWEYVTAMALPIALSPIYYYARDAVYTATNTAALLLVPATLVLVTARRSRYRWLCFAAWWFVLTLLPESNLIPLAQLRADRFLYLPLFGVALAAAVAWERWAEVGGWSGRLALAVVVVVVIALGAATRSYAGVWRTNVTAWVRVVERHPWCAMAHTMLGRAYYDAGELTAAHEALRTATRLQPAEVEPHLYLAYVYADAGAIDQATKQVRRVLKLAPGHPRARALHARLERESVSSR